MDKDLEIKQLRERIEQLKNANAGLKDQIEDNTKGERYQAEQKALSSIIDNNHDHYFKERYDLKGKQVLVVAHAPSVIEQADIQAELDRISNDKFSGFTLSMKTLFTAIAYFRIVADQFPLDLSKLDRVYNTSLILQAWRDYSNWLETYLTPTYDKKKHPYWNANLTPELNKLGGINQLVKSPSGRNMWAIMKMFRVLPNDPLLKQLTFSQREFIIQSMNQDVKDQERASRGAKTVAQADDPSFAKKFYSNKSVDLLEDGDDLDDIYKQSLQIKQKVDAKEGKYEDYDKVIRERIARAVEEKDLRVKNAKNQQQESWQQYLKDHSDYVDDED